MALLAMHGVHARWSKSRHDERCEILACMQLSSHVRACPPMRCEPRNTHKYIVAYALYHRYPHTFTFSRHLLPPPPDWPDTTAVSGPLLLNQLSPPPTPPPHPDTHTNTHTNTSDTPHIALTGADRYSTAASTLAKALTATHSAIDDLMPELSIASYHGLFLDSSDVLENVFASVGGSLSGTGTGGTGTGAAQTPTAPKGAAEPQRRKGASYRSSLERAVPAAAAAPAGAADIPPTADTKAHHDKAPVTNGHATAARTDGEPAAEDDTGEGEGMDECVSGGSGEGGIESAFARASTQLLFMPLGLDDFLKAGMVLMHTARQVLFGIVYFGITV